MFKLKAASDICRDETVWYDLEFDEEVTTKDFIEHILTKKDEWGGINIVKCGESIWNSKYGCEYSHGKLKSSLPEDILNKPVVSGIANGGWSLMSYFLYIH